ncbi:MAG: hypothetical protein QXD62_01440 [Candidatus Woesearchaeota archaeon]
MSRFKLICIDALLTTILVFSLGYAINSLMDSQRVSKMLIQVNLDEVNRESFELIFMFRNVFYNSSDYCYSFYRTLQEYKEVLTRYGKTLEGYGTLAKFHKDVFRILQYDFYTVQINLFHLIETLNKHCSDYFYIYPIIFVYEFNNENDVLQGYALEDFVKKNDYFFVISIPVTFASVFGLRNESSIYFYGKDFVRNETPLIVGQRLEEFLNISSK